MEHKYFTVAQIAEELGVSPQTIYNHIQKQEYEFQSYIKIKNRVKYIHENAVDIIRQSIKIIPSTNGKSLETISIQIETILNQMESRQNETISSLNNQINELKIQVLDQNEQLKHKDKLIENMQILLRENQLLLSQAKKPFWNKIFRISS